MEMLEAAFLAILQGLTEFLPISSSGHLVLTPAFFGWEDPGLAFDVAVHVGTLAAVLAYFRHELAVMSRSWVRSITGSGVDADARLAWAVLIGTIPAGLFGFFAKSMIEGPLRSPLVIAATTIGFGALLWVADKYGRHQRDEHSLGWPDLIIIGLAQAISLIPGTSRSGITITAGLMLGLERSAAARFSFLLSVPIIALAGIYLTYGLVRSPAPVDWSLLALGALLSAAAAYATIDLFIRFVERIGMLPFAIYRLLLGALILYVYL